ncbi:type IV toxin-antitoxin system AbiEi family antitoxin domain-containing protein [Demequina aestuarii]|uniref:type IV toxin-antitoxin system AbiEi family antitoxin domain-containing protein n=1 Tax=Demequina aestuarii TaxID=327095 RepID=UPI00078449AB|nr:type IV toxin-antitoxin system AbiEi family antitoxin domain-containing protein [Demequina aestuarii]
MATVAAPAERTDSGDMHPVPVIRRFGGAARWKQLSETGVSHAALTAAVARGEVRRVHRGCYALPGVPEHQVLATIFRGTPTCVSYARQEGLPVYPGPAATHLQVPQSRGLGAARRRPDERVVLHRIDLPTHPHPMLHLDLTHHCVGPREQLAILDGALNAGLVRPEHLELLVGGTSARREWLRRHADPRSQSLSETCARVELVEAGLDVVPQFPLNGVGRVDFLVEGVLVVEIDSQAHHSEERARARDGDRDRASTTQGYPHLRYMFHDALDRPEEIVADVIGTLMRFGYLTPELRTRIAAASRVSGWRELH